MTLLKEILYDLSVQDLVGSAETEISGLAIDSRNVRSGFLFVAMRGTRVDGHDYIDQAISNGAVAIVCEERSQDLVDGVTYIHVKSSVEATAIIADNYYGHPAKDIKLVGITGTNGKTTVATLGWQLSRLLGMKAGLFSTVAIYIDEISVPATHTTPDILQIYEQLARMRDEGCSVVYMEVSSHALDQRRTLGLEFDLAVFTNATRDHLDYHGDFKNYLNAKKLLFDNLSEGATALICADDKHAEYMVQNCKADSYQYGLKAGCDFYARILENTINGLLMRFRDTEVSFQMSGSFNAQNLLAAYGMVALLGANQDEIIEKWSLLTGAEGRMDQVRSSRGVLGIVDYAHTPDALENLLKNIVGIQTAKTTIITVIGCGGDRDRGKRPIMAATAAKYSDLCILTSDNPRTENPVDILDDMYKGIKEEDERNTFRITNRDEAIKLACQLAKTGDIIIVAGKGHEKYQEINGKKFPFDDKKVLQQYLK